MINTEQFRAIGLDIIRPGESITISGLAVHRKWWQIWKPRVSYVTRTFRVTRVEYAVEAGGCASPVIVPQKQRHIDRAYVEAGLMPLAEYVRMYGSALM